MRKPVSIVQVSVSFLGSGTDLLDEVGLGCAETSWLGSNSRQCAPALWP